MTTTPYTPTATGSARVGQLVASHRLTQAGHRNALGASDAADLDTHQRRLQRITTVLRESGHDELATALDVEAGTGATLLALLTADDDTSGAQLADALTDYQHTRHTVDTLLTSTSGRER